MLRQAPIKTATSFEEYLEFESNSSIRHEFVDGNLFVMAGGTKQHNFVANRCVVKLFDVAIQKGCYLYSADVITRTPTGKGYYPDVLVTCDPTQDSSRTVLRPSLIIEVLSPSTEIIDRGEKWEQYQNFHSLLQYILLASHESIAEVYTRQGEHWIYERITGEKILHIVSLDFSVLLSELYQNLPPEE